MARSLLLLRAPKTQHSLAIGAERRWAPLLPPFERERERERGREGSLCSSCFWVKQQIPVGMARAARAAVSAVVLVLLSLNARWVGAQVHHVVGGDRGWDASNAVGSWSSGRVFRVGDKIWFAYSAAQEGIVEVVSRDEYESCDVSNPIRMYTGGIDCVPLEEQGVRYFASNREESCKGGLKLHVEVQPRRAPDVPKISTSEEAVLAAADGPAMPSAADRIRGLAALVSAGLWLFVLGLF
ncbi:Phytocyanin domain-containing protein [Psidium guajava]|nr:Phytocyanin domain-containing protein [Psidium guajava]